MDTKNKALTFDSYAAFVLKFVDLRLLGSDAAEADPDAHALMDWHFKVVTWVFAKHGWAVAGA